MSVDAAAAALEDLYGAAAEGDGPGVVKLLAPDAFVLTPESNGLAGAEAIAEQVVARGDVFERLHSTDLRVGVSASGTGAWASDQLKAPDGSLEVRVTAALSHTQEGWRVDAAHCSIPRSNDEARRLVGEGRLRPGVPLDDAVPAAARPVVELLDDCIREPRRFAQACSSSPATSAFGSAADEVLHGEEVRSAWEEFVAAGPQMTRRGGVVAGISEHSGVAWLGTHIDISFDITRPYRFLIVFGGADDGWEMVSIHDSVSADTNDAANDNFR